MNRSSRALLVAIGAAVLCGAAALPGDTAPTNELPNPCRSTAPWGNLPEGRKWGALNAVDIDRDGASSDAARNPGWLRGIRIGNLADGKVLYRIPDPLELEGTSAAEGVAVDAKGNVYGGEVGPRQLVRHFR